MVEFVALRQTRRRAKRQPTEFESSIFHRLPLRPHPRGCCSAQREERHQCFSKAQKILRGAAGGVNPPSAYRHRQFWLASATFA